jgi:hypothetical protein
MAIVIVYRVGSADEPVQLMSQPTPHQNYPTILPPPHNSTTTTVMEKALEDLELHKGEAEFSIRKTAERYGLSRATLQRK